jgi:hypothetical protein
MKRLHKFLAPVLAVGAAFAVAPATTGCASEAYLVETSPPPARAEVVYYRPGHVYVQGHWVRSGGDWRWRNGYYVRERPNYVFMQPRWERRGRSYVYIEGGWQPRGRVVVRRR